MACQYLNGPPPLIQWYDCVHRTHSGLMIYTLPFSFLPGDAFSLNKYKISSGKTMQSQKWKCDFGCNIWKNGIRRNRKRIRWASLIAIHFTFDITSHSFYIQYYKRYNRLTKWDDGKTKKVRWAKLVPVCWLIQGLLSATLRKYNITEIRLFLVSVVKLKKVKDMYQMR